MRGVVRGCRQRCHRDGRACQPKIRVVRVSGGEKEAERRQGRFIRVSQPRAEGTALVAAGGPWTGVVVGMLGMPLFLSKLSVE